MSAEIYGHVDNKATMSIVIEDPLGLRAEKNYGPFGFCERGLHPKYTRIVGCFDVSVQVDVLWACDPQCEETGLMTSTRFLPGVWRSVKLAPLARYFTVKISKLGGQRNTNSTNVRLEICSLKTAGPVHAAMPAIASPPSTKRKKSGRQGAPNLGEPSKYSPTLCAPDLTAAAEKHRLASPTAGRPHSVHMTGSARRPLSAITPGPVAAPLLPDLPMPAASYSILTAPCERKIFGPE